MDFEEDEESGTFTLRIKSRSGEFIDKIHTICPVEYDMPRTFQCHHLRDLLSRMTDKSVILIL